MSLSTLAKPWYPEIQDLIARTTVDILPGEASPKLIYPTEQTQGIIIGWYLKKQRDHLTKEVGSPAAGVEEPHTSSQMSEIDAQEVYEVSDTWDKSRTMDRTAESMENDVYDAAEVERSVLAEDEKLAERLRREFEVQHGRDHEPRRPGPVTFFYEGLDSPALGLNQAYLDLKLNFKDELTYFVSIPVSDAYSALTLSVAVPPHHKSDGTSYTRSHPRQDEDAAINLHLSVAGSFSAEAEESRRDVS